MNISYPLMLAAVLAWLFILFASSYSCGLWVLKKFRMQSETELQDATIAIGIGMALFSYGIFTLAALGLLSHLVLFSASMLWMLWLIPVFIQIFHQEKPQRIGLSRLSGKIIAGWGVIVFFALLNFIPAFVPETGWDGMAYHLALPKIYLQAGGFVFRPDIFHNLFPQFTEMFYLAGMIFPFGIAAKGVHFLFGVFTVFVLAQFGKAMGRPGTGLLAGILYYAQYLVHMESTTAFIDLTIAAYAALGMFAVYRYLQSQNIRWLYLTLFFAGVIAANKWHGLIIVGLSGVIAFIHLWLQQNDRMQEKIRKSAWVMVWGSLPVLPYMIRAWIMGKNPIWPLAYSIFGGKYWDAVFAQQAHTLVENFAGVGKGFVGLITLPYNLLVHGAAFGVGGDELRWPLVGCIFILLCTRLFLQHAPFSKTFPLQGIQKITLSVGFVIFVVIWFLSSPQIRFLMPLFPFVAWWAGDMLVRLWEQKFSVLRYLTVCIGLLFFLFHPPIHRDTLQQIKVIVGQIPPDIYCHQNIAHYPAMQYLNENVHSYEKVLLFGENRGFYLDVNYLWGDPVLQKIIDYRSLGSMEALGLALANQHVGWVLIRNDIYDEAYMSPDIVKMMETMLGSWGEKKFDDGKVRIYQLADMTRKLACK